MKSYILPLAICLALLFTACAKNPENGELDGQWQLMEMQTKTATTDADYKNVVNKKQEQIYWRFQLDLLMIHSSQEKLNGYTNNTAARFTYGNNKLNITDTYIRFHNRDSLLTPETTALEEMGISGNAEKFDIKSINSKRLVLKNENKVLVFRKF